MRSFALATSIVSQDVLYYWLNKSNEYGPGMMKAAYGTFLTDLIVMYEHDFVADLAAEAFNVSWYRSSPAAFSLCNDYNCLYITGESNHDMGMSVNGSDNDVWKFRFTCSFAYSLIEQLVGSNIWQDYTIGSVTLGLLQSYMDNKSLELSYENGYYFLKVVDEDYSLLVLDPVTGIVRDIFSFNGLLGTMPCYHDEITNNAIKYGNSLLIINSSEVTQLNFLYIVSSCCSIVGSSFSVELGTVSSYILNPIGLSAICILIGFQLISPFLAEISRNNSLYSIADFYDLDLSGKIESWVDYYFYQDGIIMDGINEFNTDFYIENYEQIEINKKQNNDLIKNCMIQANRMNIPFQFFMGSGDSKPKPWMLPTIIIISMSILFSKIGELINFNSLSNDYYSYDEYFLSLEVKPDNSNSIIINQSILNN